MPTMYDEKTLEQEYKEKQETLNRIKSRSTERLHEINHIFGEITYEEYIKEVDSLNREREALIQMLHDIAIHEVDLWEEYDSRKV